MIADSESELGAGFLFARLLPEVKHDRMQQTVAFHVTIGHARKLLAINLRQPVSCHIQINTISLTIRHTHDVQTVASLKFKGAQILSAEILKTIIFRGMW